MAPRREVTVPVPPVCNLSHRPYIPFRLTETGVPKDHHHLTNLTETLTLFTRRMIS